MGEIFPMGGQHYIEKNMSNRDFIFYKKKKSARSNQKLSEKLYNMFCVNFKKKFC